MEAIDSGGLTFSLAEESIERILELSEDAEIRRRRDVAKDSLRCNTRTETIVHTTLWLENFTTFLEQLSAAA
jgi:hypothetical protein